MKHFTRRFTTCGTRYHGETCGRRKITQIETETVKGTFVYEAEVVLNGKQFDILVSPTGKYLGTEEKE